MAEVAQDLRLLIEQTAARYGLEPSRAAHLAREVDQRFRARNAGARVPRYDLDLIRAAITREFTGTTDSRDRLCARLGISRSTFYRVLGSGGEASSGALGNGGPPSR